MTLKEAEAKYLNKVVKRGGLSYRIYNIIELGPWAKVRIEALFEHLDKPVIPPGEPNRANIEELEREWEIV